MKKTTYMTPATQVLSVQTSHMVCVSGVLDGTKEITDPSNFGSRRRSTVWEDDEEE